MLVLNGSLGGCLQITLPNDIGLAGRQNITLNNLRFFSNLREICAFFVERQRGEGRPKPFSEVF